MTQKLKLSKKERDAFKRAGEAVGAPCWLCGAPIRYDLPSSEPASHALDHRLPVSVYPHLFRDMDNWEHSHRVCNEKRGNRPAELNVSSGNFW